MKTKSLLTVFVLVSLFYFVSPTSVSACSCAYSESVEQELDEAGAVFTGTVTSITNPAEGNMYQSSDDPLYIDFDVEDVFKGDVTDSQRITTLSDDAACGFPFQDGESYVVFASKPSTPVDDGTTVYRVSLCSMTQTTEEAESQNILEELSEIAEPSDPVPFDGVLPTPKPVPQDSVIKFLMEQVIILLRELIGKF